MTVINCYSVGVVNANIANVGGFIGYDSGTTVNSCYYDGVASGFIPKKSNDKSKLTTGMKQKVTFSGWDFSTIWNLDEGTSYPYLRNVTKPSRVGEGLPLNDVAGGKGTLADPYLISTKEQMNNVKYDLTGSYKLINNIDLQNVEWTPIGTNIAPFIGTFDGDGFSISNLKISKPTIDFIGLFGYTNNVTIKNLTINNVNISGNNYVGALAGYAAGSTGVIQNCSVTGTGTVTGKSSVGGLAGCTVGNIDSCYSTINVTLSGTGNYAGGLVGQCGVSVTKSYATGNITSGGSNVGGLIGSAPIANGSITQCYASGNVSGTANIGGLIGYGGASSYSFANCFALGNVTATSNQQAGGFIGWAGLAII